MNPEEWPTASLGPVARAKVLASAWPSAAWVEGVLDAPYRAVWSWISDLEHSIPQFDTTVTRVRVRSRRPAPGEPGVDLVSLTATAFALPLPFDVRLEDGFCLMRGAARLYLVIMAAEPHSDGARTHFCHVEAVPLPGTTFVRRYLRRETRSDLDNLTRLAKNGFPG